jgi:predicted nucleic acid-binding protein
VAIKWYVPEADSDTAAAILRSDTQLLAPELLLAEVGSVLWRKVRRGELRPDEGEMIIDELLASSLVELVRHAPYLPLAYSIATRFDRTVYDALYVAVALIEDATFITADARLVHSLAGTEIQSFVAALVQSNP